MVLQKSSDTACTPCRLRIMGLRYACCTSCSYYLKFIFRKKYDTWTTCEVFFVGLVAPNSAIALPCRSRLFLCNSGQTVVGICTWLTSTVPSRYHWYCFLRGDIVSGHTSFQTVLSSDCTFPLENSEPPCKICSDVAKLCVEVWEVSIWMD
jgi:hypothetical protein